MKTYRNLLNGNVFMATDEKLIEVKLLKETLTKYRALYEYEHNGKVGSMEVDIDSARFDNLFYYGIDHYKSGKPIMCEDKNFKFGRSDVKRVIDNETGDVDMVVSAVLFKDNRPMRKELSVDTVISTGIYCYSINFNEGTDVYKSEDECLAFNKVVAFDSDGKELPTYSGYMLDLINFSDEQKEDIENLRKAIEKVNETCTFACGYNGLFVINGKHEIRDRDWAECDDQNYKELFEGVVKLPEIFATHMDSPVIV